MGNINKKGYMNRKNFVKQGIIKSTDVVKAANLDRKLGDNRYQANESKNKMDQIIKYLQFEKMERIAKQNIFNKFL